MRIKDKQLVNSTDVKKKVTIVKCFICNQLFYSQSTFDTHMKTHQSKLNRNVPQQIQRKTQQSFGITKKQSFNKKNTTLQSISQNQLMQKKMNKTQKLQKIFKKQTEKEEKEFSQQFSINNKRQFNKKNNIQISPQKQTNQKQVQEINQALRQSSILMNQIMFLTQLETHHQKDLNLSIQKQAESDQQFQKVLDQKGLINQLKINNFSLNQAQNLILKTSFQTKSLQNCQIQLQHLGKLIKFTLNDNISRGKIIKIKQKIMQQVMNQLLQVLKTKELKINLKNEIKGQNETQVIRIQNTQMRNCCQCYLDIEYGQQCVLKGKRCFHQDCFQNIEE